MVSISALSAVLSFPAVTSVVRAAGFAADPFDTEALVRRTPLRSPSGAQQAQSCSIPSASTMLSLTDVVDLALCNNPQTRQAWATVRVQAAQVGASRAAYLPNLNAAASVSRNWADSRSGIPTVRASPFNERNADLTLSYLLYDFGARGATLENVRQLLAAAAASQDNTVQAVFLAAVQTFYQVQATSAALTAALQTELSTQESFKAADARYRAGAATPADSLQAQTAHSQAVLNRVQAEANLKNAQGTLANALGLDAYAPLRLAPIAEMEPPQHFEQDVVRLVEQARRNRPDLVAAQAQWRAAQANVDAARASGRPTVLLSGSTGYLNDSGFPSSHTKSVGITLSVPLFAGFATTYRVRAAQAQVDVTAAQFDRTRLQVALDVWQAYQNLLAALQSVRASADLLASAMQSQRVALGRYQAGVGTIIDLLTAESALAAARQQRVQSLFNWNVSRATLGQAMGELDYGLLATMPGAGSADPANGVAPR